MVCRILSRARHQPRVRLLNLKVLPFMVEGDACLIADCERGALAPDHIDQTNLLERRVPTMNFAGTIEPTERTYFQVVLIEAVEHHFMSLPLLVSGWGLIEIGNASAIRSSNRRGDLSHNEILRSDFH